MARRGRKILLKILRVTAALVILILIAFFSLIAWLNSNSGKRWITKKITTTIETKIGSKVTIGFVDVHFPGSVTISDVYIQDYMGRPMIRIKKLDAILAYYNFLTKKVTIDDVSIDGLDFHLQRYTGEPRSNFGYVLWKLNNGNDTTATGKTELVLKNITLANVNFKWDDWAKSYSDSLIDWDHIDIKGLAGHFTYLVIDGADINAKIRSLNFKEKSGFELSDLQTIFRYTRQDMEFESLYLQTPYTTLTDYLKFDYDNPGTLSDFVDSVKLTAHLRNSDVSLRDLALFGKVLENHTDVVNVTGDFSGEIADLRMSNLEAKFGKQSYVRGKGQLKGLPSIDETFIDVRLSEAHTDRDELVKLLPELTVPPEISKLGMVDLSGNFTGFINDFVTYATFRTGLGEIRTDLNMKLAKNQRNTTYSGRLELNNFNLGKFTDEPMLGLVTMNGNVEGRALKLADVKAHLVAEIQRIDLNGYPYSNLRVNGDLMQKFFNGSMTLDDPNAAFSFTGTIDFRQKKPAFNFVSEISHVDFYALHISRDSLRMESRMKVNISGLDPDEMEGNIVARHTQLFTSKHGYRFDSLDVTSVIGENSRTLDIFTDMLTAKLSGDFRLTELPDLLKQTGQRYLDSGLVHYTRHELRSRNVDFDIQLRDLRPIFDVFGQNITVKDSGYFRGSIAANGDVKLTGIVPGFTYEKLRFTGINVNANGEDQNLNVSVDLASLHSKDSLMLKDFKFRGVANSDNLKFDVSGSDAYKEKQAKISGILDIEGKLAYLSLDQSHVIVHDTTWSLSSKTMTIYGDTLIDFPLITFNHRNETVKLVGKYSTHTSYPIRIILENLRMATITAFAPKYSDFHGEINGQVLVNNINKSPIVESAVYVSPIRYGTDTLGIFTATSNYDEGTGKLTVDAHLQNGEQAEVASTTGYIAFTKRNEIDFTVNLNRTKLKVFQPFLEGLVSNIAGTAIAELSITGTASEPVIKGNIDLEQAAVTIDYLKTRYTFSHKLTVDGHNVKIKDLVLTDVKGNHALMNGKLDLTHFANMFVDLEIAPDNFQLLNTTQKDNQLYFGTAYGSGIVDITGPLDNIKMYMKLTTDKNTFMAMPVTSAGSYYGKEYIKFIDKSKYLKTTREVKLNGLQLSMDLEITPDATAQIIFDPRVGDIIEGNGHGNLRLDMNLEGDFSIFGTYYIDKGSYLFTAYDVINKNFAIQKGGSITWHGSPYDADVNIEAIYKVTTSLTNLASETVTNKTDYNRKYPVQAILNLKGNLFQPDIKLDFNIDQLNSLGGESAREIENQVRIIKANEQELNKQVASLLVFSSFAPTTSGLGGTGAAINNLGNTSIGDLASNQINYMLSRIISNDVRFNFDYRKGEELNLGVSTDLFKNKVTLSGNYDIQTYNYNTQLSYRMKEDGNLRGDIFSRSNNNPLYGSSSSTIGIGLFVRKEFDSFRELFSRRKKEENKP